MYSPIHHEMHQLMLKRSSGGARHCSAIPSCPNTATFLLKDCAGPWIICTGILPPLELLLQMPPELPLRLGSSSAIQHFPVSNWGHRRATTPTSMTGMRTTRLFPRELALSMTSGTMVVCSSSEYSHKSLLSPQKESLHNVDQTCTQRAHPPAGRIR